MPAIFFKFRPYCRGHSVAIVSCSGLNPLGLGFFQKFDFLGFTI
jgi:hypothetical protein